MCTRCCDMTSRGELTKRELILEAAAEILSRIRYLDVSLEHVAAAAGLPVHDVQPYFRDIRDIAIAILDAEGASMRHAQEIAYRHWKGQPLEVLRHTFRLVGQNMATVPIVRAGMRIAAESLEQFPERNIDPYRTWRSFVLTQLSDARGLGMIEPKINIEAVAWLLVSAGIGTKELVSITGKWADASKRLDDTLGLVLTLISSEPS